MPSSRFQPSFAGGVISPSLHGRIDVNKYDIGLRVGSNIFVHAHGGVSSRPGTQFIGEVMDHAVVHRLIPFKRDFDDQYVMVMGDQEMKIIFNGDFVETTPGTDYNPTTPFAEAHLPDLDYVQSVDVMYFAHQNYYPRKMSRTAATSWTFSNIDVDPDGVSVPTGVTATPDAAGSETYNYKVSGIEGGIEGFASSNAAATSAQDLSVSGAFNTVSWTTTGADEYYVYRERNGVYGYIGFTPDTSFDDDNIAPDLTKTEKEASTVFSTTSDYPSSVSIFQQRLVFGGSPNEPETIWASRVGDYENFTKGRILLADDRIKVDVTGPELNNVQFLVGLRELIIFTMNGEFTLSGPDGALDATNPILTQYGYSGSNRAKPQVVEDTIIFADKSGRSVRDFRYAFEQSGYAGNDLSIFSEHFFRGKTIIDWAFVANPDNLLWVVLDDGTLLSFTYKREHQVWAWTEHDVGGAVESVASIWENGRDVLYLIVRRTIGGATKRYIERMTTQNFSALEDAYFVDCGITYDSTATTTISGLSHLNGETVVALADGEVVTGLVVSAGEVTLPTAASTVHVGLSFTAELETLPPPIDLQDVGSSRGRPFKASTVWIQLENTIGIKAGPSSARMAEVKECASEVYTGMVQQVVYPEWNREGTIWVKQENPLPMTILGISPDYSIGRTAG